MKLTLDEIHPGNWRIPLSVREEQRHYVSEPNRLLARAYALREQRSVANHICLDGEAIGMLMYHDWPEGYCYVLSQFFIDQRWQGKGYGYAAMQILLDVFRQDGRYHKVELCYCEGNDEARRLYEKCGFVHTGEVDEGEVIMRLELQTQPRRINTNTCYTYFKIQGYFDPDEITRRLMLQPDETEECGKRQDGSRYPADWCFGRCDEYSPYVEEQMRKTIAPLLDKTDILRQIRAEYDATFWLEVVPTIHPDESTPCFAPPLDVIDFCHETRTEIDIDLYIEGD